MNLKKGTGTGVFDRGGKEIKLGDFVSFLYVTPVGRLTDVLSEEKYEIIFDFGSFGFWNDGGIEFISLVSLLDRYEGEYISNKGNKIILEDTISVLEIV